MPDLGLTWSRPDFAGIAAGFGLRSWRPASVGELRATCAEAAAIEGPCLIDAQIDSSGYLAQMKSLRG
jgi:acetolactate synthase-1/2/3 large subunit